MIALLPWLTPARAESPTAPTANTALPHRDFAAEEAAASQRPASETPAIEPTTAGAQPARSKKLLAAGAVGLTYAAATTWAYFAWFRGAPSQDFYLDGWHWFGVHRYSGGADKLGHLWANHALARTTTEILMGGGWRRWPSSLAGSGLSLFFLGLSELEDGFRVGFETGDLVANAMGAGLSLLLVNVPALDDAMDFRLCYWPSAEYRESLVEEGNLDFAQDYSGQSYLLAFHLGAIPGLKARRWLRWAQYVDLVGGFETRNYTPPPPDPNAVPRQTLFLGLALNMQGVLRTLFAPSMGRNVGHVALELIALPYTTVRVGEASRSPN